MCFTDNCRLVSPMVDMFDKHSFGATKFEQDATNLKYTIDITGFDTDAIKVPIEIMF